MIVNFPAASGSVETGLRIPVSPWWHLRHLRVVQGALPGPSGGDILDKGVQNSVNVDNLRHFDDFSTSKNSAFSDFSGQNCQLSGSLIDTILLSENETLLQKPGFQRRKMKQFRVLSKFSVNHCHLFALFFRNVDQAALFLDFYGKISRNDLPFHDIYQLLTVFQTFMFYRSTQALLRLNPHLLPETVKRRPLFRQFPPFYAVSG